MVEYSITLEEYQWVTLTMFLTAFLCWTAQEILERQFGMSPRIITAKDLHTESATARAPNPMKHYVMNKRLTKSLDHRGQFRIQTRGTVYFIKAVWCFLLCAAYIILAFIVYPEWQVQHFYHLNASTVWFAPNMHFAGSVFAFYIWETTTNRYGRLVWSVLVHHWLTVAAALAILLGRFSPFATWYFFAEVALAFPIFIALGFRAQFSNKYPYITRNLFVCSLHWYIFTLILNFIGQILIVGNSLVYHFNESLSVYYVVVMICSMMAWLYDDIQLTKALHSFSKQNYEDAQVLNKQDQHPRIGGRSLFAQAVIKDLKVNKLLAMTTSENSALKSTAIRIPMKQITASKRTTSATLMKIDKLRTDDFNALKDTSLMNEKESATQLALEISMGAVTRTVTDTLVEAITAPATGIVVENEENDSENQFLYEDDKVNSVQLKTILSNEELGEIITCIQELDTHDTRDKSDNQQM
eukprot:74605_1